MGAVGQNPLESYFNILKFVQNYDIKLTGQITL